MADKRNISRHRKRLTLRFGIDDLGRLAFTEDISPTGVCIKTAHVSPPGTILKIELTLPDGNLVKLGGTVVWAKKVPANMVHLVKKCGMGIKFQHIEEGKEQLEKFCADITAR